MQKEEELKEEVDEIEDSESEDDSDDDEEEGNEETSKNSLALLDPKAKKAGIIYLSRVPLRMNVKIVRDYMSRFGKVGRIFLEPQGKNDLKPKKLDIFLINQQHFFREEA